jgi:hypothetical protein
MKLDGLGDPLRGIDLYYVQFDGLYAGDFVLWWGKNRSGYTYKLEQAGIYTGDEAASMPRKEDVPWPAELVERNTSTAVDVTGLHKSRKEFGHFNPPPGYAVCTRAWPHVGPCAHPAT